MIPLRLHSMVCHSPHLPSSHLDLRSSSFTEKLSKLLGKFGSKPASFKSSSSSTPGSTETPDPDSPKVDDPFSGEDAEATKAKLEELMRLATPVNSTVKLTTTTVPLERVPMTADDKTEARKRFAVLSLSLLWVARSLIHDIGE